MKAGKYNKNEEKFKDLLKKIKGIQRITQGRISILAGYKTENYLSEAKSNGNITDDIIENLEILYEKAKNNPNILKADRIYLEKTDQQIIEERGERLFALEVAMKALTGIVLDIKQEISKQPFSEVKNLWEQRTEQAQELLMKKVRNE